MPITLLKNLERALPVAVRPLLVPTLAPKIGDALHRVADDPRHLRSLPWDVAVEVAARVTDPVVLARLLAVERRVVVGDALRNNPRSSRARRAAAEPLALPTVVSLFDPDPDRFAAAQTADPWAVVDWLAGIGDPDRTAAALDAVYGDLGRLRNVPAKITVAVLAGEVPVPDRVRDELAAAFPWRQATLDVADAVAGFAVLTGPLAEVVVTAGCPVPWRAFDRVDRSAVDVLATSEKHLSNVVALRLLDRPDAQIAAAAPMSEATRMQVMWATRHVEVVDALTDTLTDSSAADMAGLLAHHAATSTATRMKLLGADASTTGRNVIRFAQGQFASRPRPGELTELVAAMAAFDRIGWLRRVVYDAALVEPGEVAHDGFVELVDALVAHTPAKALYRTFDTLEVPNGGSVLMSRFAGEFAAACTSPEQWSTALTMLPDWEQPLPALLATAAALG